MRPSDRPETHHDPFRVHRPRLYTRPGLSFAHLYAEGYPDERTRRMSQADILAYESELGHYRRYGDPRYYKGVEYADVLESLARRRIAELFATKAAPANKLYVNVQPLSGRRPTRRSSMRCWHQATR